MPILFTLLITFMSAQAEYRAFELVITDSATGNERVQISTLDPNQYRTYYPVKYTETVQYRATWMCRGNTSARPICSRPEEQDSQPVQPPPAPSLDQKSAL